MRPVRLEFEGINSFSEHTIIDFEKLTIGGIFGIFGDTGSGKSTILDCINFALYGKVERSKEKSDIINYKCAAAWVKYTFSMTHEGKRRNYYVERTLKKDKNSTHKAVLYEDDICIADKPQEVEKKVVEILGVDSEDFRKCIALPQGEFAQFVKSAPRERLALIERVFSLSKYGVGLKDKLTDRQNETETVYQNLAGRLSNYEEVGKESISELEKLLISDREQFKTLSDAAAKAHSDYAAAKALYEKYLELQSVLKELREQQAKKSDMDELRRGLSVLPVCREAVKLRAECDETEESLKSLKQREVILSAEIKKCDESVIRIENNIAAEKFDEKIKELTELSAKYQTCKDKPYKLTELKKKLQSKRDEFTATEKEIERLINKRELLVSEAAKIEAAIGNANSGDLSDLISVSFKGAILRSEYAAMLDYFVGLSAQTERYADGSKLYKFIHKELEDRIELYKQRVYDVKDFKLESVNQQLADIQKAIKAREENSSKLSGLKSKISEIDGDIKLARNKSENIKKEGAELRARTDELAEELKAVFGEVTDYSRAEEKNRSDLGELKERLKALSDRLEKTKNDRAEMNVDLGRVRATLETTETRRGESLKQLNSLVECSGLGSFETCNELAAKFSKIADAEKTLSDYDASVKALTSRKNSLISLNGIENITGAVLENYENAVKESDLAKSELSGRIAVKEEKLKELKIKLKEKEELLVQFKDIEKKKNLLSQLKEVTKNNKFLEFIANEYLNDISVMASSTLLKLTDGRYFLAYRDNYFSVGDNYNCGNLRGVNTLSGGETFLVSLSLALSLSQTICARSLKSIEFFFLDEGFGTLDGNLVETVMNALEKLKNSDFTIGVISHVEELKHRIDRKIIVAKATESHGSTVQFSY